MRHAPQSAFAAILEFTKLTQLRIATARHQQEKEDYTQVTVATPLGRSGLLAAGLSVFQRPLFPVGAGPSPAGRMCGVKPLAGTVKDRWRSAQSVRAPLARGADAD